jgi:hypothetical protein
MHALLEKQEEVDGTPKVDGLSKLTTIFPILTGKPSPPHTHKLISQNVFFNSF